MGTVHVKSFSRHGSTHCCACHATTDVSPSRLIESHVRSSYGRSRYRHAKFLADDKKRCPFLYDAHLRWHARPAVSRAAGLVLRPAPYVVCQKPPHQETRSCLSTCCCRPLRSKRATCGVSACRCF